MFGLFQEWGRTSKGGPKLKIDNKWVYPTRTCNMDGLNPGMQVEYETTPGGNDGKLTILQRIRPAPAGSPVGSASPQTASTITDGDILRSVSNVVGSMAAAGQITHPDQIKVLIDAAYAAFTNMGKAQAPAAGSAPKEPEFDDSEALEGIGMRGSDTIPPW